MGSVMVTNYNRKNTDIRITTATAVMKPCSIARLRTTSMNPSRKNPSRKEISPDYNFAELSEPVFLYLDSGDVSVPVL